MSLLSSASSAGLTVIGTVIMGSGYLLTLSTPLSIGRTTSHILGAQMMQAGLIIIVAGIVAWFVVSLLQAMGIV